MRDPFRNYDAWLEAPYQRMYAEGDAFVDWCERNDVEPDADDAWEQYQDAVEAAREEAAERRAEARWEDDVA